MRTLPVPITVSDTCWQTVGQRWRVVQNIQERFWFSSVVFWTQYGQISCMWISSECSSSPLNWRHMLCWLIWTQGGQSQTQLSIPASTSNKQCSKQHQVTKSVCSIASRSHKSNHKTATTLLLAIPTWQKIATQCRLLMWLGSFNCRGSRHDPRKA